MGHRRTGTRCTKLYWGLAVKEERRKRSIGKFENAQSITSYRVDSF